MTAIGIWRAAWQLTQPWPSTQVCSFVHVLCGYSNWFALMLTSSVIVYTGDVTVSEDVGPDGRGMRSNLAADKLNALRMQ